MARRARPLHLGLELRGGTHVDLAVEAPRDRGTGGVLPGAGGVARGAGAECPGARGRRRGPSRPGSDLPFKGWQSWLTRQPGRFGLDHPSGHP
ncbi:MAG: hypothetical protein ACYCWW_02655 [Deltaproteobacteria bacterium]